MLTALNDDSMNALHVSCMIGSQLINFIVHEADRFGIRNYLINMREKQGRTPLFFLCKLDCGNENIETYDGVVMNSEF